MSTSDADKRTQPKITRRRRRLAVGAVVVLLVMIACDCLFSFLFERYGSLSSIMWEEYRAASEEPIDTVVVGSSTAQRGIDPHELEAGLSCDAFTMATPAQTLGDTYTAAKQAIRDHHVRRIVLGLDYESISIADWPGSHVAFTRGKMEGESLPEALGDYARLVTGPEFFTSVSSIGALFPWAYNHVDDSADALVANVQERLSGDDILTAAKKIDPGWTYYGDDYGNYEAVADYSTICQNSSAFVRGDRSFDQDRLDDVAGICNLCRESGVELIVIVTPRPAFNVLVYGDEYPQEMSRLQQVVESHGASSYDFNLATAETYDPKDSDFADSEHLNHTGAIRFSQSLASVVAAQEAGESTSQMFYSYGNWGDYLSSIREISAVSADIAFGDAGASVTAVAYAGTDVHVEYQFWYLNSDGSKELARDWSQDSSFTTTRAGEGMLIAYARQVGSDVDYEKSCIVDLSR